MRQVVRCEKFETLEMRLSISLGYCPQYRRDVTRRFLWRAYEYAVQPAALDRRVGVASLKYMNVLHASEFP